ncbi:MAG: hypothetical protein ACHP79_19815, partial [Terriglobales bacterium]
MRTTNWMVLALLVLTMSAVAQQSAPETQYSQPASTTQPTAQPAAPVAQAAPVTMDQVVDRVIEREKAAIGVLITMEEPTKPMVKEAAEAGFYKDDSPFDTGTYPRIQ